MRKYITLVLALVCMLGVVGCSNSEPVEKNSGGTLNVALTQEVEVIVPDKSVKLSEEDAKRFIEILENGKWVDSISACDSDCKVVVSDNTMTYHSECGTFNDSQNQRSMTTNEETQQLINDILKNYVTLGQLF
jgi:hypothetical protein